MVVLEIIKYCTSSFWVWLGSILLLAVVTCPIGYILHDIIHVEINTSNEKENSTVTKTDVNTNKVEN